MRASTIYALTVAVLLGLAVVVIAKYTGLLNPAEAKSEEPLPQMLVAARNLFEGLGLTPNDVTLRPMTPREFEDYTKNPDKYLPPMREAAYLRILRTNVEAGQPILKAYFEDLHMPDNTARRLPPGTRAVNISVPKDRAAGGLIMVGDHVDVYLTSTIIPEGDATETTTRTARIARNAKVVVKRDNLWEMLKPIDPDKPSHFTLATNPYRAALIEYAKLKGLITLVPVPTVEVGRPGADADALAGPEFGEDPERVQAFLEGELVVGNADLERIFRVGPLPTDPPPVPPIQIERLRGVQTLPPAVFPDGDRKKSGPPPRSPSQFSVPNLITAMQ